MLEKIAITELPFENVQLCTGAQQVFTNFEFSFSFSLLWNSIIHSVVCNHFPQRFRKKGKHDNFVDDLQPLHAIGRLIVYSTSANQIEVFAIVY